MDKTTFLDGDKTTSFPKRDGLIRNTTEFHQSYRRRRKKYPWFLRVGSSVFSSEKQKEQKLHDYYINLELLVWNLKK